MIAQSIVWGPTQGGGFRCPAIFTRKEAPRSKKTAGRVKSLLRRNLEFEARTVAPRPPDEDFSGGTPPEKHVMRVLLRNAKTGKFLQDGTRWTRDPKLARDFRS